MILSRTRTIFLIVWLLLFILGITIIVYIFFTQSWRFTNDAEITELVICQDFDDLTGKPIEITRLITDPSEPMFACGYLKTSDRDILSFYLFRKGTSRPIDSNEVNEIFSEGYFNWKLDFDDNPIPGTYTVDVYLARKKLASTSFRIIEP